MNQIELSDYDSYGSCRIDQIVGCWLVQKKQTNKQKWCWSGTHRFIYFSSINYDSILLQMSLDILDIHRYNTNMWMTLLAGSMGSTAVELDHPHHGSSRSKKTEIPIWISRTCSQHSNKSQTSVMSTIENTARTNKILFIFNDFTSLSNLKGN